MPDNVVRGVYLLGVAVVGLLALIINQANDGSETAATVVGVVTFWCGAIGVLLLVLGLVRDRR